MSVFTEGATTPEAEETIESYLDRIVEEKGENWKDPETLARGKYEADKFIKDLQRQIEELREDVLKAEKIDQLMETIKSQNKDPHGGGGSTPPQKTDPSTTSSEQLTDESIRALIESHVSKREQETTRQKNLREVEERVTKEYGATANATLAVKARELGMTLQEMEEISAKNPKAFFRLVGLDASKPKEGSMTVGNARASESAPSRPTGRDWNYYQDLRRKNKSQYHSSATQLQMIKDREAMGEEAFYGRRSG